MLHTQKLCGQKNLPFSKQRTQAKKCGFHSAVAKIKAVCANQYSGANINERQPFPRLILARSYYWWHCRRRGDIFNHRKVSAPTAASQQLFVEEISRSVYSKVAVQREAKQQTIAWCLLNLITKELPVCVCGRI